MGSNEGISYDSDLDSLPFGALTKVDALRCCNNGTCLESQLDAIHSCLIQSAVGLMRTGHFSEASSLLGASHREGRSSPKLGPLGEALLSDALQRIGRNDEAQRIATKALGNISQSSHVAARCHFVLGSILRERGNTAESIERLQIAGRLSHHDLELSCWIQLRLVAAIADLRGNHAALACLDETKRILTRFGDARPFAALHLWLVEAEAKLGHFIEHAIISRRPLHYCTTWMTFGCKAISP